MPNQVVVVGSANVDQILQIPRLPQAGESLKMQGFSQAAGGKGANQAVAAARSGAAVAFVGAVGNDANGTWMREQLTAAGVQTKGLATRSTSTGQAFILLQANGENSILVHPGANALLTPAAVAANAASLQGADFVVAQCEIAQPAIVQAFQIAKAAGKQTLLNPAPAAPLTAELLQLVDVVVPNETESAALSGIKIVDQASLAANAQWFLQRQAATVIITLGAHGAYVATAQTAFLVPAFAVPAVDTTAAGDTFIGALVAALTPDGGQLKSAVRYASMASALAVQRLGAQPSIPTQAQVQQALANEG
ncbi:ribokinase [Lacticaseibacillus baoqingensis]|uniref:Ribokinase n=1 Tax=Lacticaseibacillus baoqingensis TaxID=2486013 RepID=A0ABW4E5B8_9LACO|nr:ribokinase [Lacticaseibacillus baoqingensis]